MATSQREQGAAGPFRPAQNASPAQWAPGGPYQQAQLASRSYAQMLARAPAGEQACSALESVAPPPEAMACEDPQMSAIIDLKRDLGQVRGLDGLNAAVGHVIDAAVQGPGARVSAELGARVEIPSVCALSVRLEGELENDGAKKSAKLSSRIELAKVFDLVACKARVGVAVDAEIEAKGDTGAEVMDLMMLAFLPGIRDVSGSLANCIYGDAGAYQDRVVAGMEAEGEGGEGDEASASLSVTGVAGFETRGKPKAKGSIELGAGARSTLKKRENGKLEKTREVGLVFRQALEVGGVGGELTVESAEGGRLDFTVHHPFRLGKSEVLNAYLIGKVQAIMAQLVPARDKARASGKDPNAARAAAILDRAINGCQHMIAAQLVHAPIAGLSQDVASGELEYALEISGGTGCFRISLVRVLEVKMGKDTPTEVEASLRSGQDLFRVDL